MSGPSGVVYGMRDHLALLRGHLTYEVWYDGRLVDRVEGDNLVVAGGASALLGRLAGDASSAITQFGVGTRGDAPAAADRALEGAVLVPVLVATSDAAGAHFVWELPRAAANGMAIREFGLFTAAGVLVARKTRPLAIQKTPRVALRGAWTLTYTA